MSATHTAAPQVCRPHFHAPLHPWLSEPAKSLAATSSPWGSPFACPQDPSGGGGGGSGGGNNGSGLLGGNTGIGGGGVQHQSNLGVDKHNGVGGSNSSLGGVGVGLGSGSGLGGVGNGGGPLGNGLGGSGGVGSTLSSQQHQQLHSSHHQSVSAVSSQHHFSFPPTPPKDSTPDSVHTGAEYQVRCCGHGDSLYLITTTKEMCRNTRNKH